MGVKIVKAGKCMICGKPINIVIPMCKEEIRVYEHICYKCGCNLKTERKK